MLKNHGRHNRIIRACIEILFYNELWLQSNSSTMLQLSALERSFPQERCQCLRDPWTTAHYKWILPAAIHQNCTSLTNWRKQQSCWNLHDSKLYWVINEEQNNHGGFSFLSFPWFFFLFLSYANARGGLLTGSQLLRWLRYLLGEPLVTLRNNHMALPAPIQVPLHKKFDYIKCS